jgi:hypothetical protein
MELPIDVEKLTIIVIGEASPVMVYGTQEQKKNKEGQLVYKLPVLIQGTGDRQDPTTSITFAGEKMDLPKGSRVNAKGLTLMSWTLRSANGTYRSGTTLRAKSISVFNAKA